MLYLILGLIIIGMSFFISALFSSNISSVYGIMLVLPFMYLGFYVLIKRYKAIKYR